MQGNGLPVICMPERRTRLSFILISKENTFHSFTNNLEQKPNCKCGTNTMAKNVNTSATKKNYSNYAEVVGNVAKIFQSPDENKSGDLRFSLANHRSYTKKDGTKVRETEFFPILVKANRKWAKQSDITKGAFIRVIGHHENNAYLAEDGTWKGGFEICADKVVILKARDNGQVENTETGEVETISDENENVEVAEA